MMSNELDKILHLYRRAGFGLNIQDFETFSQISLNKTKSYLLQDTEKIQDLLIVQGKTPKIQELRQMTKEEKRALRKKSRNAIKDLNLAWVQQLGSAKDILREKMALFWHGHFACQPKNIYHAQIQLNMLRKNALGNFKDLLLGIAKDPAMILYLNNQQNRRKNPNENFARELMELFTLGRGNYTEQDVKESARAFTGWGANGDEFVFRERLHDFENKTFFGKTGNWNGDNIINMILEKKETAYFICQKIYQYFVNPEPDSKVIQYLAERFYKDYDIKNLMQNIFSSDWFYDEKNIGAKIKSPIELMVGFIQQFNLSFRNEKSPLIIQRILGQMLFNPPNVAGWKGNKAWIDSSSLLFRIKLSEMFFKSSELYLEAKAEDDAQKMSLANKKFKNFQAVIEWEDYLKYFKQFSSSEDILEKMSNYLLSMKPKIDNKNILIEVENTNSQSFIKDLSLLLTSLPEYQIC